MVSCRNQVENGGQAYCDCDFIKNTVHPNDTFLGGTYVIEETRRAHTGHTGMETVVWIVCWADWFLLFVHMFYNVYFL